jgi:hypothetical protein
LPAPFQRIFEPGSCQQGYLLPLNAPHGEISGLLLRA